MKFSIAVFLAFVIAFLPTAALADDGKDNDGLLLRVRGDVAIPAGQTVGSVVVIDRAAARDPDFKYEMVLADEKAPHVIDIASPVVQYIREASRVVQGGDADVVGMSWLGDSSTFGPWVPTVIYGPGRVPTYMPNEYLSFEEIETPARVYALTAAYALTQHLR